MAFSVRRSLAWMSLSQGGIAVLGFASSIVVARLLTPYEMGVFAVATAIAGVLGMLRMVGLGNYIIRAPALDRDMLAGVFTVNALLAALVSLLVAGVGVLGDALLGEPGVHRVLLALALVPLLATLELLPAACIEREGNFRVLALVNLGRAVVSVTVMIAAAATGHSFMSLAYGQLASAAFAVVAVNAVGRHHASLRPSLHGWRPIARYGFDMLTTSGVSQVYTRMSDLLLGWFLGLHALGLYSRATGLVSMLFENFQLIIMRVLYVDLVAQRRMGMSYRASYLRLMWGATAVLWPAFGGLAVVSGPALGTLYGAQWVGGAPVLSLLCVAAIIGSIILMAWEMFLASGETRRLVRLQAAQATYGLALFALGCLGGIVGAAVARIAEAVCTVALYRPHLRRLSQAGLSDLLPVYRQGLLLTALAVGPAALAMAWHGWSPAAPLMHVLPAIAAGMLAWAAGLWALDHPLWREVRRLTARVTGSAMAGPMP